MGLVACQDLSDGEVVLEEAALVRARASTAEERPREAMAARLMSTFGAGHGELRCPGELMVRRIRALVGMEKESQRKVLALAGGHGRLLPLDHPLVGMLRRVAEIALQTLQLPGTWSADELEQGLQILVVYGTKHELMHEIGCHANHACTPNSRWTVSNTGKLRLYAVGQIAAGEEVTISYAPGLSLLHWQARHRFLWDNRAFICRCWMCAEERAGEETTGVGTALSEPDAEPDSEPAEQNEPEMEATAAMATPGTTAWGVRPALAVTLPLPRSHLRCVRCCFGPPPLEQLGLGAQVGRRGEEEEQELQQRWLLLDRVTYARWLADARAVPVLRRVAMPRPLPLGSQSAAVAVAGASWWCPACGLRLELRSAGGSSAPEEERRARGLAEAELQLVHRALEHCAEQESAKLLELWPTCERILGPWHGVTLFSALHAMPLLDDERAYKIRARLALAGVDDALIRECAW